MFVLRLAVSNVLVLFFGCIFLFIFYVIVQARVAKAQLFVSGFRGEVGKDTC